MNKIKITNILILIMSAFATTEVSANYYGRLISGAFISKEIFKDSAFDRYNDVFILSERMYVNFDKINDTNKELTVDIRDKENFFDKMNNETLKLTAKNKLQLHQMNIHTSDSSESVEYSIGRFPISEAGSLFLDGFDVGFRKTLFGFTAKFSLFYGLNPHVVEDSNINLNPNLKAYGVYGILERKSRDWDNYFLSTCAITRQVYKSETDRLYLFNNTNFNTSSGQNFSSVGYLDLVPELTIQNLWATYLHPLTNKFKLRTSLSTIDSLHYYRIQDIRETLPSSRYNQGALSLRSPGGYSDIYYETKVTYGMREVDKKNLMEFKAGAFFPKIIWEEVSGTANAGIRKNFVSNDIFGTLGGVNSNKFREIAISQSLQTEQRVGKNLNLVFITDGSYTKFFDRSLFGIVSLQNTMDSNVNIFSIFLKVSYRFGEGGQAPAREGSPPMGQL